MRQKNYGLTDRQRHKGETVFFLSFGAAVKKASTYIGIHTCTAIKLYQLFVQFKLCRLLSRYI